MKITQEVRDYAEKGMFEMSEKFRNSTGEVYQDLKDLDAVAEANKAL